MKPWEIIVLAFLVWLLFGAASGSEEAANNIEERIDPCVTAQTCR